MDQSSSIAATVSFASCHESLKVLVEQTNAELARLAAAGITVDPAHIRYTVATGEYGTRYLASFGYSAPTPAEAMA